MNSLSTSVKWILSNFPDGYVYVDEILTSPRCWLSKKSYTEADILQVVEQNDKQRFSVRRDEDGRLEIRANQGHSVEVSNIMNIFELLQKIPNKSDNRLRFCGSIQ